MTQSGTLKISLRLLGGNVEARSPLLRFFARSDRRLKITPIIVHLGSSPRDLGHGVRLFAVFRYVVVHRPVVGGIQVLRVIHGSRDVARVFREELS